MYLSLASSFINADRWPANLIDYGTGLFVAHRLLIDGQKTASGKAASGNIGVIASKSVADISKSYDNSLATDPSAGHWNLTTYGLQYQELVRMLGAGPVQLGGAGQPAGTVLGSWY